MANELKITDVVDSKAITQLQNLKKEVNETYTSYKNFIDLLAKGMQDKPSSLQDLSNKSANYNKVLSELITTQNKLSDLQKEHETVLQRITQQTKENVAQILAEAKANDLNAAAELKAQKAETERLKQQKMLNQEKKKLKITTEEAISLTNKEVHSINEAKEQNKLLRAAVAQVTDAEDRDNRIRQQLNNQIAKNTEYIRFNSDAYTRQKMAIGAYKNEIKAALVELKNGNNTFKSLGIVAKGFGGILKSNVSSGFEEVKIGVGSMIKGMVGAQAVISGFQKLIGLFKSGVQSIVDFEAANSKLAAILGTTSNNIKDLTLDAQRLGSATKYTASEATNLQIELAKLGFSRKEILQSTEGILKFAQATGADLPEAAALAGASLRMFDAETRETERYVSAMAVATTKSALSFSYLQTAMPIVGPVAKAFNFQIEDTLALLGKLADAGFDASMSATATRNILLNLADGSGELAKALGGPVKTLPELVAGLKKLKEQGVDLNTTLELTDKRSVAAFNAFLTAADKIVPLREQITGVTGELNDMANTMGDNVKGSIAGLSSAWEALMLSFSNSKGVIKDVIDFLARGIRNTANQFRSLEDKENEAIQNAIRNQREIASEFKIEERYINEIKEAWQGYMDSGMSSTEAFRKAVDEKKEYLNQEIAKYDDTANKAELYYKRTTKAMQDSNMFTRAQSGVSLSDYEKRRNIQFAMWAEAEKSSEKYKYILENVEAYEEDYISEHTNKVNGIKKLTDEEKKELEKQHKERLRIQQEYQQSELDLMDEGLGKELARIRLNYTKRIAAVKGNTQEEIKTRENLTIAMEDELSEKIYTYNQNKEKINLQNRLEALSTNSKDELDQRLFFQLRVNEILKDAEKKAAEDTGADVSEIEAKYLKKRNDIIEKNILARIGLIEKDTAKETNTVKNGAEDQLRAVELQHRKGEINEKKYRQKTYEITRDSIKSQLQLLEAQLQAELEALGPADAKSDALKEKIEKVKSEIKKLNEEIEDLTFDKEKSDRQDWADGFIDAMSNMRSATEEYLGETASLFGAFYSVIGKMTEEFVNTGNFSLSKWWKELDPAEKASMILQAFGELFNGITSIVTSAFDSRIEQIEEEQEKNQAAKEEELENIEKLAENGAISTEEAEARKRAAEDRTAQKDKELEKQKAELKQKQARWDKANSIIQATIATALAVTKALPNFVLAAIVGALGAAQVAMIAAQPIPKYAKGTDNHPGGLAIVGDGGKQEVITTDDGAYITPSVPTLVDIPKRAKVIPNLIDYRKMALHSDALMLDRQRRSNNGDEPVIVNVNNDYRKLERNTEVTNEGIAKLNRTFRKIAKSSGYRIVSNRI